jgi:enoyl-CoA hydratase/carnithine racemase
MADGRSRTARRMPNHGDGTFKLRSPPPRPLRPLGPLRLPPLSIAPRLIAAVEASGRAVETLTAAVDASESAVEALTVAVEALERAVEALTVAVEALERAVEALTAAVEALERAVEALTVAVEAPERAVETLTVAVEASDRVVEALAAAVGVPGRAPGALTAAVGVILRAVDALTFGAACPGGGVTAPAPFPAAPSRPKTPPMTEGIRVEDKGPVRRVTFDRPAKKNAITLAMYKALSDAFAGAAIRDATSVVLVDAAGDAFTAGNDIGDFMRASAGQTGADAGGGIRFLHELAAFPKPVVAAVNGLAIGIGSTLLLHCDLVVASSAAIFQFPFTKLAIVPEAGSSLLLPLRVGAQRANEWLLLGERIDAQTALDAGFINAVVAPAELASAAAARAEALTKLPLGSLCETKRLIREPFKAALADTMGRELEAFGRRLMTPEAAAAFQAFFARK